MRHKKKKGLCINVLMCELCADAEGLTVSGEEGEDCLFWCGNEKRLRQAELIGAGLMTASSAAQWLHT